MKKYHKYVFDLENRKFVGNFEEMYRNEETENFDSWHQDDSRQFHRQVALALLSRYNFNLVVDIGCGKGAFTQHLKRQNNEVHAVDISPTAVRIAAERYPDINFSVLDINQGTSFDDFLKATAVNKRIDLIFCAEVLSYIADWRSVLAKMCRNAEFVLISLFIPEDPIGFVKSAEELIAEAASRSEIVESIRLEKSRFVLLLLKGQKK